jgi:hypothetical protein
MQYVNDVVRVSRGAPSAVAALAVLALGLAGCAGTPEKDRRPQPERVAAAAVAEATGQKSPVICEDVQEVGSRMTKRVCRTPEEIASDREEAKSKLSEYRRIGRVRGARW